MAESAQKWKDELKRYDEAYADFEKRGDKIVSRYIDDRKEQDSAAKFNILWSNVRTLKPAIYSRAPNPEVSRRFKDKNPIARVASTILERCLSYEITQFSDYHSALENVVEDRLLPGRGVAWIRYEPVTEAIEEPQITEDSEVGGETSAENYLAGDEPLEQITSEITPVDYVYWKDFKHSKCRTWEEVTWVSRTVYLSEDEGVDRFGGMFKDVPRNCSPDKNDDDKETTNSLKKAEVVEIWDKSTKKVYWIAKDYDKIIDEKEDPLGLDGFFPCPKPVYATITTGSLIPTADYILYQDQAKEIDNLTGRIQSLTDELMVRGIYAAEEKALADLLSNAKDGDMIPIKNWAAFAERGGLQNVLQFFPLKDIVFTLGELYKAREACKQIVYETTGISDILRGASMASETLGAQQIKAQYASIRLNDMKDDVARFARDLLRMKAEVMCSKYQPKTLLDMSGLMGTPDAEYAQQAIDLLKNEPIRNFSIDIENDTLVQIDEETEKKSRVEFLGAVGQFIEKAVQASQAAPALGELMGELLLFGVRGFKIGKSMESTIESTLEQIKEEKAQRASQPPPPNPEMMKMQADAQAKQADMQHSLQIKQAEMSAAAQTEQFKASQAQAMRQAEIEFETQKETAKNQLEKYKIDLAEQTKEKIEQERLCFERWKAELASATSIVTAQISAKTTMDSALLSAQNAANQEVGEELGPDPQEQMMQMHNDAMGKITEMMAVMQKPKRMVVKDAAGNIVKEYSDGVQ